MQKSIKLSFRRELSAMLPDTLRRPFDVDSFVYDVIPISGIITGKFPKQLLIENNGIEWDICVPDSNLDMFGTVGSEAKVFTWLQHTDVSMALYGFASAEERTLFFDLLKVDKKVEICYYNYVNQMKGSLD